MFTLARRLRSRRMAEGFCGGSLDSRLRGNYGRGMTQASQCPAASDTPGGPASTSTKSEPAWSFPRKRGIHGSSNAVKRASNPRSSSSGRIDLMPKPLSAEDIFPLVDCLSSRERLRLLRLISTRPGADDRDAYHALPPRDEEFSSDEDPLAWDAEGWEGVG